MWARRLTKLESERLLWRGRSRSSVVYIMVVSVGWRVRRWREGIATTVAEQKGSRIEYVTGRAIGRRGEGQWSGTGYCAPC